MNLQTNEFSISFDETEARIVFEGVMRLRSARDYDDLKQLLRTAHALDLPTLEPRGAVRVEIEGQIDRCDLKAVGLVVLEVDRGGGGIAHGIAFIRDGTNRTLETLGW